MARALRVIAISATLLVAVIAGALAGRDRGVATLEGVEQRGADESGALNV